MKEQRGMEGNYSVKVKSCDDSRHPNGPHFHVLSLKKCKHRRLDCKEQECVRG